MSWLRNRYFGLSVRERKQLWFILILAVLAGYFFFSAWLWQQMFDAERMADRRANRIETRIGQFEPPTLEEGISDKVLQQQQQLQSEQEQQLRDIAVTLLPLHDAGAREQFKLELSQLAEVNNLQVRKVSAANTELRLPVAQLEGEELRQYLIQRPEFNLQLTGYYLNLVHFVRGLQQLSYSAHIGDMSLEPAEENDGRLQIQLQIRI